MTSDLDSIALAVAHLEKLSNSRAKQAGPVASSAVSTSSEVSEAPPRPQSFQTGQTSRVVSSESIASSAAQGHALPSTENDAFPQHLTNTALPQQQPHSNAPPPNPQDVNKSTNSTNSTNNNLALILADPSSWLQATEHISKLPEAPAGTFDKILQEDVLCGRGGESNHHPGNQQYRRLVKAFQPLYIASKRRDKPRIAQCIVYTIRSYGGRFLKRTSGSSEEASGSQMFEDVGNTKAREKTSQALREGAPELRSGKDTAEHVPAANAIRTTKQPSPLTIPPGQQPGTASSLQPSGFLSGPLLQQLPYGSHATHFHHPYFSSAGHLSPLQQALLAATTSSGGQQSMLSAVGQHGFVENVPPAKGPSEAHSLKRALPHVVSSEDNSSTSSDGSASVKPRGPRLKRLKHRLQQENEEMSSAPIEPTKANTA